VGTKYGKHEKFGRVISKQYLSHTRTNRKGWERDEERERGKLRNE
jgi:hypothetical protein